MVWESTPLPARPSKMPRVICLDNKLTFTLTFKWKYPSRKERYWWWKSPFNRIYCHFWEVNVSMVCPHEFSRPYNMPSKISLTFLVFPNFKSLLLKNYNTQQYKRWRLLSHRPNLLWKESRLSSWSLLEVCWDFTFFWSRWWSASAAFLISAAVVASRGFSQESQSLGSGGRKLFWG